MGIVFASINLDRFLKPRTCRLLAPLGGKHVYLLGDDAIPVTIRAPGVRITDKRPRRPAQKMSKLRSSLVDK